MRRVLIVLLAVLLALSAHAAVNVTLSLPDDAPALLRAACARANGGATPGACSAPEAAAWFSAQIDSRVLEGLRNEDKSSRRLSACDRWRAASQAAKDTACAAFGESAGCDPCADR